MELTKSFSGSGRNYFAAKARVTKKGKLLVVCEGTYSGGELLYWPDAWQIDEDDQVLAKVEGSWNVVSSNMAGKWASAAVRQDGKHVQIKLSGKVNRDYGFAFDIS